MHTHTFTCTEIWRPCPHQFWVYWAELESHCFTGQAQSSLFCLCPRDKTVCGLSWFSVWRLPMLTLAVTVGEKHPRGGYPDNQEDLGSIQMHSFFWTWRWSAKFTYLLRPPNSKIQQVDCLEDIIEHICTSVHHHFISLSSAFQVWKPALRSCSYWHQRLLCR